MAHTQGTPSSDTYLHLSEAIGGEIEIPASSSQLKPNQGNSSPLKLQAPAGVHQRLSTVIKAYQRFEFCQESVAAFRENAAVF